MKRLWVLITLVLALPVSGAADAPLERLLAQVPDDAALIVVVPNLEKLASGIAAFGKAIEVDDLADLRAPQLLAQLDLLDEVAGLDVGGPLLLARAPDQSTPLILATVKDAEAWKQAVGAQETEGGLLRVQVCCASTFATINQGVLIIGDDPAVIRSAQKADGAIAKRFRTHAGELLASHGVVCYVEMAPWRSMVDAALMAAGTYMQMGMAMSGQADESLLQMWKWVFDECGGFVRDVDVFLVGMRPGADGVFVEAVMKFPPDSSVGKYLGKVGKTRGKLLRGLLDENSTLVFGCEWDRPAGGHNLNARMMKAMLSTGALEEKLGSEVFKEALHATLTSYDLMTGYNGSIVLPTDGEGMTASGLYFTDDPQGVMVGMHRACELSPEFLNFGTGSTTEITLREQRIDDVKVNVFEISFTTEDEQVRRMLERVYGRTMTLRMAPHPLGVAFAMGPADAALARLRQVLAGAGRKLVDNHRVAAAGKALSPDPQIFILVDLPKFVEFALNTVRASGAPVPAIEFAQKPSAFIAWGGYLQADRFRAELFVPAEPVKVVVDGFRALKESDEDY